MRWEWIFPHRNAGSLAWHSRRCRRLSLPGRAVGSHAHPTEIGRQCCKQEDARQQSVTRVHDPREREAKPESAQQKRATPPRYNRLSGGLGGAARTTWRALVPGAISAEHEPSSRGRVFLNHIHRQKRRQQAATAQTISDSWRAFSGTTTASETETSREGITSRRAI